MGLAQEVFEFLNQIVQILDVRVEELLFDRFGKYSHESMAMMIVQHAFVTIELVIGKTNDVLDAVVTLTKIRCQILKSNRVMMMPSDVSMYVFET